MPVVRTLDVVLRPNKEQERKMLTTLKKCCFLYNHLLEFCRNKQENNEGRPSYFDLNKHLTCLKKQQTNLKDVYSQVLTNVSTRVTKSFDNYLRRLKAKKEKAGYPRFKSLQRYDSFTYPQNGFVLNNGYLTLSKIGAIKAYGIRKTHGQFKICTIKREGYGPNYRWKASLVFICDEIATTFIEDTRTPCGIDLDLIDTVTVSDGTVFTNTKNIIKAESTVAKILRKKMKYEKGTDQRNKFNQHIFHLFSKIKRTMKSERYFIVNKLVKKHNIIAIEKLNIQALEDKSLNKGMRKSYRDATWDKLLNTLKYKAEEAGSSVLEVNPSYTSQMCSKCGNYVEKDLSERRHHCPFCGLDIGRDLNAAINILRLGLQALQSTTDKWKVFPVGKMITELDSNNPTTPDGISTNPN